jgi:hypothetical protein
LSEREGVDEMTKFNDSTICRDGSSMGSPCSVGEARFAEGRRCHVKISKPRLHCVPAIWN